MKRSLGLSLLTLFMASAAFAQYPYPVPHPAYYPYQYAPYPQGYGAPAAQAPAPLPPDIEPLRLPEMPAYRIVSPVPREVPPLQGSPIRPASAYDPPAATVQASPLPVPNVDVRSADQPMVREVKQSAVATAPAATDHSFDPGCGTGCSCFQAGIGVYYVKPYFDTNPAFARAVNVPTTGSATTSTTQENFEWGFNVAPLVWLEFCPGDCLGLRGRFWRLDDSPDSSTVSNPFVAGTTVTQVTSAFPLGLGIISNPGGVGAGFDDQLLFRSSLLMEVYDLEVTKRFRLGATLLGLSGGVRYARLNQTYDAFLLSTPAVAGADTVQSNLTSNHDFRGVGGTLALEVFYPIGCCGLSLFASGRGSLLYGTGREAANLSTVTTDAGGLSTSESLSASTSQDRLLPVGEIELGVEYAHRLGRGMLFVQAALVDQVWFGAGNASNNETITGTGTVLTVPATQVADNHINLGLFGLRASLGIRY